MRGEVVGGACELLHGDLEVGVGGPGGVNGEGGEGGGWRVWCGSRSGRVGAAVLVVSWEFGGFAAAPAGDEDGGQEEGDHKEAGGGGGDGLGVVIHE